MHAQIRVTIPWSSSLYVDFNTPLKPQNSDFPFAIVPSQNQPSYSITNSMNDAGRVYVGPFTLAEYPPNGAKMLVRLTSDFAPKDIFRDTVRNLCTSTKYLFWAGINMVPGSCFSPELTFSVQKLSGEEIATFNTGQIGGELSLDHYSWYPGFQDIAKRPKVPFYGGMFKLPPATTDVVVKITTNTASPSSCFASLELDNILLTPIGADINIESLKYPGGWIAATCFEGNTPLELNGRIEDGFKPFGTFENISDSFLSPVYQWQQSLDDGYTWLDIAGENRINISHNFNLPDTFWMRLTVAESTNGNNPNCRVASNVVRVHVDGLPKDFSMTANSPVCTDGDLKFELTGGVTYTTYGPNGFIDNSPFPHKFHPGLNDGGLYYSEIKSLGGCIGRDSVSVKVIGPSVKVSNDTSICYGNPVKLYAIGGTEYKWSPSESLDNSSVSTPIANPVITTTYQVYVTDTSGCGDFEKVTITLRDSLLKVMFFSPDVACPGDVITFIDTSIGNIVNYSWSFGNGNTSNLKNPPPQLYPLSNGENFPVMLKVTDTGGCVQTFSKYVKSVNNCFIAVPSAFTPNSDGVNDYLYPLNAYKSSSLLFQVFSRKGQKIFETKDWTKKWDGTYNGNPQDAGAYVWILRYTDENKKQISLKGTSVLIR